MIQFSPPGDAGKSNLALPAAVPASGAVLWLASGNVAFGRLPRSLTDKATLPACNMKVRSIRRPQCDLWRHLLPLQESGMLAVMAGGAGRMPIGVTHSEVLSLRVLVGPSWTEALDVH